MLLAGIVEMDTPCTRCRLVIIKIATMTNTLWSFIWLVKELIAKGGMVIIKMNTSCLGRVRDGLQSIVVGKKE